MKIAILFHDADMDGKLSNEVCRHWLRKLYPEAAIHSYGWDYGRPVPPPIQLAEVLKDQTSIQWEHYDSIYIVDLSVDELMEREDLRDKITWIDHHASALSKYDAKDPTETGAASA